MQQQGVRCGDRFAGYEDLYGRALRATRGLSEPAWAPAIA